MDGSFVGALVSLLGMAVGGSVWLVRLEGRSNTETQLRESQNKNTVERLGSFESRIYEMLKDIQETLRAKADK